jgi:hypothetical protein
MGHILRAAGDALDADRASGLACVPPGSERDQDPSAEDLLAGAAGMSSALQGFLEKLQQSRSRDQAATGQLRRAAQAQEHQLQAFTLVGLLPLPLQKPVPHSLTYLHV